VMDPRPDRSPYREPPPPCKHRWGPIWRYIYDARANTLGHNYEGLQQCEKCDATRVHGCSPSRSSWLDVVEWILLLLLR